MVVIGTRPLPALPVFTACGRLRRAALAAVGQAAGVHACVDAAGHQEGRGPVRDLLSHGPALACAECLIPFTGLDRGKPGIRDAAEGEENVRVRLLAAVGRPRAMDVNLRPHAVIHPRLNNGACQV